MHNAVLDLAVLIRLARQHRRQWQLIANEFREKAGGGGGGDVAEVNSEKGKEKVPLGTLMKAGRSAGIRRKECVSSSSSSLLLARCCIDRFTHLILIFRLSIRRQEEVPFKEDKKGRGVSEQGRLEEPATEGRPAGAVPPKGRVAEEHLLADGGPQARRSYRAHAGQEPAAASWRAPKRPRALRARAVPPRPLPRYAAAAAASVFPTILHHLDLAFFA